MAASLEVAAHASIKTRIWCMDSLDDRAGQLITGYNNGPQPYVSQKNKSYPHAMHIISV